MSASGGKWRLATARGAIEADEVVIATNGYTGDATPRLKRRVIPIASHIIATEELPPDLARVADPKGTNALRHAPRALLLPDVARRQARRLRRARALHAGDARDKRADPASFHARSLSAVEAAFV